MNAVNVSHTFQEALQNLFPSWGHCLQYSEVIAFTCGLMKDPRSLVKHGYDLFIESQIAAWRSGQVEHGDTLLDESAWHRARSLFHSFYSESKVTLYGQPLHNQQINYYNHRQDDKEMSPRDTTPIFSPSKFFLFHSMMEEVTLSTEKIEKPEIPECAMWIEKPDAAVQKILLSTIYKICKTQQITDLRIVDMKNTDDSGNSEGFTISRNVQSFCLQQCQLPPRIQTHLLQQLSRGRFLTFLDMQGTPIGKEGNQIANAIKSWKNDPALKKLNLKNCSITAECSTGLLRTLSICQQLKHLDLSENTLTGCLVNFLGDPQPGLPFLTSLQLNKMSLNKSDIRHLQYLMKNRKLPRLCSLGLEGNGLPEFESEFADFVDACLNHHHRRLNIKLKDDGREGDIAAKWEQRLQGTSITINGQEDDVSIYNKNTIYLCNWCTFAILFDKKVLFSTVLSS